MATVEIRNVEKLYGAAKVVHGVSVDIENGEFLVLVGPLGCGKSTLLRMIAGLEEISGGTVSIGGEVVNDVAPKDRNIAMVFQNYALYPHMTVAENMAFSLKLAGMTRPDIHAKVAQAAGVLGLEKLLDRYPGQLSGGQRQRAAMGRAIVRDPELFLFDEPLSNLDAKLRVQMRTEIKALHQRLRTTTIYVTHDQVEAMTMADRIVVMRDGVIEQVGAPLELYDFPQNLFVASFIGSPSMNLVEGRIERTDTMQVFRSTRGAILPLNPARNYPDGLETIYGIRPEHLSIAPDNDGVAAAIAVIEPTGSETQVTMDVGGEALVGVFRERVGACASFRITPDLRKIHVFEKQSGHRMG